MKTWVIELGVVAVILLGVTLGLGGGSFIELIGSAAVLVSFAHGQVADRLAEKEAARAIPDVSCFRWLLIYFITKEFLWAIYFVMHHSYAALVGIAVFLLYPIWRKVYRKYWVNNG